MCALSLSAVICIQMDFDVCPVGVRRDGRLSQIDGTKGNDIVYLQCNNGTRQKEMLP